MSPQKMERELLTREETAELLGISRATLESWACSGRYQLPFIKVGRVCRYRRADIDKWLRERTVGPEPDPL